MTPRADTRAVAPALSWPRTLLFALIASALILACGAEQAAMSEPEPPLTEATFLGLVARPPEAPSGGTIMLEAVFAYPDQVSELQWNACPLLINAGTTLTSSGSAGTCALPTFPIYEAWSDRARLYGWEMGWEVDQADALYGALTDAIDRKLDAVSPCVRGAVELWSGCLAADDDFAQNCFFNARSNLSSCVQQEGVDLLVEASSLAQELDADGAALGDERALARLTRVRFRGESEEQQANRNPLLFGLDLSGRAAMRDDVVPVDEGAVLTLLPNLYEESIEEYFEANGTGPNGEHILRERLSYRWYRTGGEVDRDRSSPSEPAITFTLPPPGSVAEIVPIDLWLFVSDNRGGVDYLKVTIDPVPTP